MGLQDDIDPVIDICPFWVMIQSGRFCGYMGHEAKSILERGEFEPFLDRVPVWRLGPAIETIQMFTSLGSSQRIA